MAFITAVQYVYRIYVHTVNEQLGKSNTYIDYGKLSNTKKIAALDKSHSSIRTSRITNDLFVNHKLTDD